eukprot:7955250-Pyramimonas_sp.AAC.2
MATIMSSTVNMSASTKPATFAKRAGGIALPQRSLLLRSVAGKAVAPRAARVVRPAARGDMKVVSEDVPGGLFNYDEDIHEKSRKYRRNVVRGPWPCSRSLDLLIDL